MTKLLFLGFDGLDYDLLNDYLKLNREALLNKIDGSLLLMTPEDDELNTGPCWTTIYTGLSKEHHDIRGGWGDPAKFRDFPHPCIWDTLNENNISVGLFGLPVTYPPKAINGFWVSGFPTPMPKTKFNDGVTIAFPPAIQEKYLSEHIVDLIQVRHRKKNGREDWGLPDSRRPNTGQWQRRLHKKMAKNKRYIYELCDMVLTNQLSTIKKLFSDIPVDVAFIQFSFIDHIGHLLNVSRETRETLMNECYPRVNRIMEDLWSFFKPENLVIVSDHGFKGDSSVTSPNNPNYAIAHSREAVAYFHGPNIVENHEGQISNMDLMSTLLFMLDLSSPKTDGKIHYGLFKSQQFSKEDEKEINSKLRALGYIA